MDFVRASRVGLARGSRLPVDWAGASPGAFSMNLESSAPESIEAELLAQIARGDKEAFSDLYDRFAGVLFGLAARILNNDTTAAEDVLQEVFLQIWQKAASYDSQLGKPLTWAVTLTRNKAIDRLRAANRGLRFVEAAIGEQETEIAAGSDDAVISEETARQVRAALSEIPTE